MNLSTKIAYNTIIQIVGKFTALGVGLVAVMALTRYLGQAGFGKYTTIMTYLSFFAIFADMGLTLVTVQMINQEKDNRDKILSNLFTFRLLSAVFFLGLAPVFTIFSPYDHDIKMGVLITFSSFIFVALNQVFVGLFQTELRMEKVAIAEIVNRIFFLIAVFVVIHFNYGLWGVMATTTISSFINFFLLYYFSKKYTKIKLEIDKKIWKQALTKSWPIAITIFFNLIYLKADTLILSLIKTQNEVGLYGASYKIIDVLVTIPFMFAGILLPLMTSHLHKKEKENFENILQRSIDFMIVLALPMVLGTQILNKKIMLLVAGENFIESAPILKILIIATGIIFIGTMFSHAVIALDKQKKIIKAYAFTSITALVGYLIFIPKYSYIGAAWTTIYSELTIAFASFYYVWKYSGFKPNFKILKKSLLASVLMCVIIYYTNQKLNLFLNSFVAIVTYFTFLYLVKGVTKKDLLILFNKNEK